MKFAGGVMLAADTLGSYGSLARFTELRRIRAVGKNALIGAGGEYSDFQSIMDILSEVVTSEHELDDGAKLGAKEMHSYLTRIMYGKRNKGNPLYNTIVMAGYREGSEENGGGAFLGYIDPIGTAFSEDYTATGFGAYLALPIIRDRYRPGMSEEEAKAVLEDCLRVLWYRDTRALNKIQIATITASGPKISEPYSLTAKWDYKSFVTPKAGIDTGGSW